MVSKQILYLSMTYDVTVLKQHFVLDRRDGRVADASGFNGESCARNRVQFPHGSNLTQVATARHCCDVKLCAPSALKRRWALQTRGTHKGYLREYNEYLIFLI